MKWTQKQRSSRRKPCAESALATLASAWGQGMEDLEEAERRKQDWAPVWAAAPQGVN